MDTFHMVIAAVVVIVIAVLVWDKLREPTKVRLSLKIWRILHLEFESETRPPQ